MKHDSESFDQSPLAYSLDNAILMHRDAHFGGDFSAMIEYYQRNGRGVCKEFELERIMELAQTEKQQGQNLAPLMLSGVEAEQVADARQAYKKLRALCESDNPKNKIPRLIAELILTENEDAQQAISSVVAEKGTIVPSLIELLRSESFHSPLFPGYGEAPAMAARCLGLIGDKRAVITLFEAIGEGDFFNEDAIFDALKAIGQPAKEFLLKVLQGHPITADNEQAAVALVAFKDDPEVSAAALKLLQEIDCRKYLPLATYLVLTCEGLQSAADRKVLHDFSFKHDTPKSLQQDIAQVSKSW